MELILSDREFYNLLKSLQFAIAQLPGVLEQEDRDLLARMVTFYKDSPQEECRFVVTTREMEM